MFLTGCLIAGVVAAVPAAATGPASGGAARSAQVPVLTATTVLSAGGTGYVTVRLAAPVPFPWASWRVPGPDPALTVSDPAHFTALALVQQQLFNASGSSGTAPLWMHRTLLAFQMRVGLPRQEFYGSMGFEQQILPAGVYRLYVVASAPERVVWRLPVDGGSWQHPAPGAIQRLWVVHRSVAHVQLVTARNTPMIHVEGQFRTGRTAEMWQLAWLHGRGIDTFACTDGAVYDYDNGLAQASAPFPAPVYWNGSDIIGNSPLPPTPDAGVADVMGAGLAPIDIGRRENFQDVGSKMTYAVSGLADHAALLQLWLNLDGMS